MQRKVAHQLNKLVGEGHYVVTVSTLLREATKETLHEAYVPEQAAVANQQTFEENLNSAGAEAHTGGAVSTIVSSARERDSRGSSSWPRRRSCPCEAVANWRRSTSCSRR